MATFEGAKGSQWSNTPRCHLAKVLNPNWDHRIDFRDFAKGQSILLRHTLIAPRHFILLPPTTIAIDVMCLGEMPVVTTPLVLVFPLMMALGFRVTRARRKDVRLPVQLQRAMAAEAEAAREARAKVIAAEGEMKASRALKEASDVMAESPAALQLRYLQTLNTISAEKNSTIIFPLPMDILTPFMKRT
ncbi:hypothetical protein PR048_004346 [Dryococelus australis]|uniref:Prohibitin n=1 Tax=Dryococelus australis TaxID=614101 RepID=A0ABQ9I560_9NEOP|nr:hypothetical protein PR048_004346 [Dryococelus australis]